MTADRASAINSAAGVASQIPFTPKIKGRAIMVISMNTNDRENASTAETTPFDRAVNMPLAKILNPINKSAMVQILFPVTASSYKSEAKRS